MSVIKTSEVIQKLLTTKNITIYQLAQDLHVSRHTIDEWVRNKRVPRNPALVKRVANYFSVSMDFIYFGIPSDIEMDEMLKDLQHRLEKAIDAQQFEECIVLRTRIDEIKAVEVSYAS